MSKHTLLYKVDYIFSKNAPKFIMEIMIKEYTRLRHIACDRLNPLFDKWNAEYSGKEPTGDIYSEGFKEYNEYICSCEEPILKQINQENHTLMTELHADVVGDIIAVNKFCKDLTMHIEMEPLNFD